MNTIKYLYIFVFLCMSVFPVHAQSSGHSYVLSRTMTNASGTSWLDHIDYDNGLGQPVEQVDAGINPGHSDLVTLVEYDIHGRPVRRWLPGLGSGGSYQDTTFLRLTVMLNVLDSKPYTHDIYEPSPLNRLLREYKPGYDWHEHQKYTGFSVNCEDKDISPYRVMNLAMMGGGLLFSGYSSRSKLVMQTTDEDGTQHLEFRDKDGRTVVVRTVAQDGHAHTTYYVYDDSGRLRFVLPPAAADYYEGSLSSMQGISAADDMMLKYCYEYRYDGLGNCTYRRLPGCEPVYYIYDRAGRCIFSQDGVQRERGAWRYSVPDIFGREVLSGICHNSLSYTSSPLAGVTVTAERTGATNGYYGYVISNVTLTGDTLYSASFYDDYGFIGTNGIPSSLGYATPPSGDYGTQGLTAPRGVVTGTVTARISPNGVTGYDYGAVYYDDRGRVVQQRGTNHIGGSEAEYLGYDFTGNVLVRCHQHSPSALQTHTEVYTSTYDHAGRLLTTTHRLDSHAPVTLQSNSYDILGRLSSSTCNGTLTTGYTYNVRSWLTGITAGTLFSEALCYNGSIGGSTPRYGGDVSAMEWTVGGVSRGYGFTYDDFFRLTQATYRENGSASGHYDTRYSYDRMGNITSLTRYGLQDDNVFGKTDSLSYVYNGNQLVKITDAVSGPNYAGAFHFADNSNAVTEYEYDANGNMTMDRNKYVTSIHYNILNLPSDITFISNLHENHTKYTYGADGRLLKAAYPYEKLTPWFRNSSDGQEDSGIRGIIPPHVLYFGTMWDYCGNFVYKNDTLKQVLFDGGYITYSNGSPLYHFYIKDHLGNNRVVINGNDSIEQVNHYYPYGGLMGESTNGDVQQYKYNGKRLDRMHGLDWYDYGARHYDAATGSWPTMDPLCEKYYSLSPYSYCGNNPVNAFDFEGEKIIFINGKIGMGSPEAGTEYWGQYSNSPSPFVFGAMEYFNDNNYYIMTADYGWFTSAEDRFNIGYEYAKNNIEFLTMDLQKGESFNFVSHSMGAAMAEGIAKYLNEKGYTIDNIVHINPYQAADITTLGSAKTIDFQNVNDPVINIPFNGSGKIVDADYHIRSFSPERPDYVHFSPISQGKEFWNYLEEKISNQKDNFDFIKELFK